MRFLIGFLLGFALGFAGAILFAPERPKHRETAWAPPPGEEPETAPSENHDMVGTLRRALRSLQRQADEAWAEAVKAADEAEKEMWERYGRASGRAPRSRR